MNLVPMRSEDASAMLEQLLSCYPALNLTNPKPYLAQLAALLCDYPKWAGEGAITSAMDNRKYPPNRAELRALLEEQVRSARYAAQFGKRDDLIEPPREIRPSYDELKARYGDNWGIDDGRKKPPPIKSEDQLRAENAEAMKFYRDHPGRLEWLANLQPLMRASLLSSDWEIAP